MKALIFSAFLLSLWLIHTGDVKTFSYTYKESDFVTVTRYKHENGLFSTTYKLSQGVDLMSYKTIARSLSAGDSFLFKANDKFPLDIGLNYSSGVPTFTDNLGFYFFGAGTSTNHIYIGAWGTGAKPVITAIKKLRGSDSTSSWAEDPLRPNVWKYNMIQHLGWYFAAYRLFINGQELDKAFHPDSVSSTKKYFTGPGAQSPYPGMQAFDPFSIYLYSVGNPATTYGSNIEFGGDEKTVFTFLGSYLDIQNLEIQGGSVYTVQCLEGNNYDIGNCKIGVGTAHGGIYFVGQQDTKFHNNDLTSGLRNAKENIQNAYDGTGIGDGCYIDLQGMHNFDFYQNYAHQWGHAIISVSSGVGPWPAGYWKDSTICSNIRIHDSFFKNDSIGYGRFWGSYAYNSHTYHFTRHGTGGNAGNVIFDTTITEMNVGDYMANRAIRVYRNLIGKTKAPNQIFSKNTEVTWNIVDTVEQPSFNAGQNKAPGLVIGCAYHAGGTGIVVANNIFNNPENEGFRIRLGSKKDTFFFDSATHAFNYSNYRGEDSLHGNLFANNIIVNPGNKPSQSVESYIPQGVGFHIEYYALDAPIGPNTFRNNIVYSTYNGGNNVFRFAGATTKLTNINYLNTTAVSEVLPGWTITGNLNVDPLFRNNTYGTPTLSKDFSLQANSPAIGAGVNLSDFSLPQGIMPESIWPNSVVSGEHPTGDWNIGAYVVNAIIQRATEFQLKRRVKILE